jgi:hypothetical protein
MKHHLVPFVISACLATPLTAQEPYYPVYGYSPDTGYDTDDTSRQFTFSPGEMMNRMGNPAHTIFGSPYQRYYDYPTGSYAPPAYPPAYGYPTYPNYQRPYAGYGYLPQTPPDPGNSRTSAPPSDQPAQIGPTPQARLQPPAYENAPPARQGYQPMFTDQEQATRYRFRPLQKAAPLPAEKVLQAPGPEPSESAESVMAQPPAPAYQKPAPLAPLTYPQGRVYAEPMAPLTYPEASTQAQVPSVERKNGSTQADPTLKFRPLDKPGYSSDLEE